MKIKIKNEQIDGTNSDNVNRGQIIYYKDELHYIVYEFNDLVIISKDKDLIKAYCVKKSKTSIIPKK
jgi:hypothetical protein